MAIPTILVTGDVLPPNNMPTGGSVLFELSEPVVDPGAGVVVPLSVSTPILASGSISVNLWPNGAGFTATRYAVYVLMQPIVPGEPLTRILLGQASFPTTPATQDLGEVIAQSSGPITIGGTVYATIADAVAAAVAAADTATTGAATAVTQAGIATSQAVIATAQAGIASSAAASIVAPGLLPLEFASRSALVTAISGGLVPLAGVTYRAGGLAYVGSAGSTAIADLPGLIPGLEVAPQHFGVVDGVADQVQINAAINYAATAGGSVRIANPGFVMGVSAPIVLRSNVALVFLGIPNIRLANGANATVFESAGFQTAAAAAFADSALSSAIENFRFVGRVRIDGNRANNPSPGANAGHGIAIWGRDFFLDDPYIENARRTGCVTRYVSGAVGVSPFNARINSMTVVSSGENGWECGVSDLMFGKVNLASSSQATDNTFDAARFIRLVRGDSLTIWRRGVETNSHRYGVNADDAVQIGNLAVETSRTAQVRLNSATGATLGNLWCYNFIGGAGTAHIEVRGGGHMITGKIEQATIGTTASAAVRVIGGQSLNRSQINLTLSGGFSSLLDLSAGTSAGANAFRIMAFGTTATPVVGPMDTTDMLDFVREAASNDDQFSIIKRAVGGGATTGAGATQATALASAGALIRHQVSRLFASAAGNNAFALPAAQPGYTVQVTNINAFAVTVFPQTGEAFLGLAANAGVSIPANGAAMIWSDIAGRWAIVL